MYIFACACFGNDNIIKQISGITTYEYVFVLDF